MVPFLRLVAFVTFAAAPAHGETLVIRPDPCPTPADQSLIIDLGDVETFNSTPQAMLGRVLVIYPPVRDGWASARILMRFDLEPYIETPPDERCPRLFRRSR